MVVPGEQENSLVCAAMRHCPDSSLALEISDSQIVALLSWYKTTDIAI